MKKHYIALTLLLFCLMAFGQSNPPATPIDGGLGLLLAGGAFLGAKRLLNRKS